jgi:uncharacterized protein (DUF1697 family)
MPIYVGLLRAVNVGGTGKLPMTRLVAMCEDAGFTDVRTYIASGNVVFGAKTGAAAVKAAIAERLAAHAGKPVGVLVRTSVEMAAVVAANPFAKAPGNRTIVFFLDEPPRADSLARIRGRQDEELRLGTREIYAFYPSGMGKSKLVIPAARAGTARNMNTVATLADMAAKM